MSKSKSRNYHYHRRKELPPELKGQEALIDALKRELKDIHGMDPNFSEDDDDEIFTPCQTPRESQTRSTDYLKKPSMNQHAQQISATTSQRAQRSTQQISAPSRLDLPQSGSEDNDEAWLTELTGCKISSKAIDEAYYQWEREWRARNPPHLTPRTQSEADPDLLRKPDPATFANGNKVSDLPGPLSWDDDEDSSPRTQELDLAEHSSCSTSDLTTLGQESTTLTHTGFRMLTLVDCQLTGNTESCQKAAPKSATSTFEIIGEKPFNCDQCSSAFAHRSNLHVHKRVHSGFLNIFFLFLFIIMCKIDEKPYKCEQCPSNFASKQLLSKHKFLHSD